MILAQLLARALQAVAQVVLVAIQEALHLDEIDEHQPVEHHRNVPALQVFVGDALQKLEESVVFGLEALVEALGDSLHVEAGPHPAGHVHDRQPFLFFQAEGQGLQTLDQRFSASARAEADARGRRWACPVRGVPTARSAAYCQGR